MQVLTGGERETKRRALWSTARRCAERLRERPGVAGVVLYGSLSLGEAAELTRFSDVDVALILDGGLPAHFTEHRLFDGVKVDVLLFHLDTVRELGAKEPERLYQGGWVLHYLIKSFLLGGPETILFDPSGAVAAVKRALNEQTSHRAMVIPDARRWLEYLDRECLAPAEALLREGNAAAAGQKCGEAAGMLRGVMQELAAAKQVEVAAERLGIPQVGQLLAELRQQVGPSAAAVRAYRDAAQALWEETRRRVFQPACDLLRRAGIEEPEKLELAGDYPLFWPGNRLHELGRVIAEVELSLRWSEVELESGSPAEALSVLWPCGAVETARRCEGLAAALRERGYDLSHVVTSFLEDPEFRRLSAEADRTSEAARCQEASPAEAARSLALAREVRQAVGRLLGGG